MTDAVVVHGYAVRISVERGHLRIQDGVAGEPRDLRLSRATSRMKRLVVLGHNGAISLEAVRWLHDIGAGFVQVDRDGSVLAAFGPRGTDRPALRRAQAMALGSPVGGAIGRRLLIEKLTEQARTLDVVNRVVSVDPAVPLAITNLAEAIGSTDDPPGLRMIEARAALAYWGAWSSLPVRFAHRDRARVPAHWTTFATRMSPITGTARLAGNPMNALLNYLYALLEAEASIAAQVVGLDPGLGVIHADQLNRDSLSMDLMEPVRPAVDRFVLNLLERRTFAASDFFENREGVCRLMPPLAKELTATSGSWFRLVGRVAEDVARMLGAEPAGARSQPTPISQRHRSAGRERSSRTVATSRAARTCSSCGGPVPDQDRRTCSADCGVQARAAQDISAFVASGPAKLRELRAAGTDPVTSDAALAKHRRSQSRRRRDAHAWNTSNQRPAEGDYLDRVRPLVARMTIGQIVRATGLSQGHAARIRRGQAIPHPRWWPALKLAGQQEDDS